MQRSSVTPVTHFLLPWQKTADPGINLTNLLQVKFTAVPSEPRTVVEQWLHLITLVKFYKTNPRP